MKLFIASKQMEFVQHHQIFLEVASQALGGGGSESTNPDIPQTKAQAIAMFSRLDLS